MIATAVPPVAPLTAPLVPALPPHAAIGFIRSWRHGDTVPLMSELLQRLGSPARLAFPGQDIVVISRAEDAHRVFFLEQDRYPKGEEYDVPGLGLRRGLVTSRGEEWRRDRSMLNPLFAKRHLAPLAETMAASAASMADRWDATFVDGARVDVAHEMMAVTLDIAARTMFGAALTEGETDRFGELVTGILEDILLAGASPLTWLGNVIPGVGMGRAARSNVRIAGRIDRALQGADALIEQLIAARRAERGLPRGDFLDLMLSARDDDGQHMSHRKMVEQSLTFLAAGHETTATGLSWTWHMLGTNPEARERMLAEIDQVLGGRQPDFDDVDELPWTKACLQEAMRIHPPVYLSMRRAAEDDLLGGYRIRKGTVVILATHELHRDPELWPEPLRFVPDRFMPGAGKDRPRAAYLPFGSGRRVCIGSQFATIESVLILATVAQRFILRPVPGHEVREEGHTTLRPKGGLPMLLGRRG